MILESLNNSKYSLTPEKMGELVGGEQCCVTTGAVETGKFAGSSCDVAMHLSGDDVIVDNNGVTHTTTYSYFRGSNDTALQSLFISQNGGICK